MAITVKVPSPRLRERIQRMDARTFRYITWLAIMASWVIVGAFAMEALEALPPDAPLTEIAATFVVFAVAVTAAVLVVASLARGKNPLQWLDEDEEEESFEKKGGEMFQNEADSVRYLPEGKILHVYKASSDEHVLIVGPAEVEAEYYTGRPDDPDVHDPHDLTMVPEGYYLRTSGALGKFALLAPGDLVNYELLAFGKLVRIKDGKIHI